MNRVIALTVAALILLSAGWWGWTNPDIWPGNWRSTSPWDQTESFPSDADNKTSPAGDTTSSPAASIAGEKLPQPAILPPPEETEQTDLAGTPAQPALTPPPQDTPLPPETGSPRAQEIERIAEAAITAANARVRAERTARAEREALEAAQAEITQALAPFLTESGFSLAAVRDRLETLPQPDTLNLLTIRTRDELKKQILAILDDAAMEQPMASGTNGQGNHADTQTQTALTGSDNGTGTTTPVTHPNLRPYIARIKELL